VRQRAEQGVPPPTPKGAPLPPIPTPLGEWGLGAVGRWREKTTTNQQPTTNY